MGGPLMRRDFTPWAERTLTPEDRERIAAAEPRAGRAWGITDNRTHLTTVRLFDPAGRTMAEAEARTAGEAFDLAQRRVAA